MFNFNIGNISIGTITNDSGTVNINIGGPSSKQLSEKTPPKEPLPEKNEKLIFISHASDDREIVTRFDEFLKRTGVPERKIVCSSDPDAQFPTGENFKTYIMDVLAEKDTICFIFLSNSYAGKPYCIGESGAIARSGLKYYFIEMPGFNRNSFSTLLDKTLISIILSDVKDAWKKQSLEKRLEEIQDMLVKRYGLSSADEVSLREARESFMQETETLL